MLLLLVAVTIFLWKQKKKRQFLKSAFKRNGPVIFAILGTIFIMADLTRHVLQDYKVWPSHGGILPSAQYRSDCGSESVRCLSPLGWVFYISTYVGFALFMTGTLWNSNIVGKLKEIRQKWKELRS
eukprot:TRINITY_DN2008_c0_g1_i1.p2 TRINITY_DN2008_c0_g1~~TRINITY_DN2008_c0_g1_i1.p2  ORF type:complete len:126 (-),score=25.93 TRINITY_DN2008_c0_g1_i1:564-941(-)